MVWALIWLSTQATAVPCNVSNGPYLAQRDLYESVAVIGPDDRKDRQPGDIESSHEEAQARIFCPSKPLVLINGQIQSRDQLAGSFVGNATIAFEDDMALVNRHTFLKEDGRPAHEPKNCYIEQVSSGTFNRVVDAQWPEYNDRSKNMFYHRDIALVRFQHKLKPGTALKDDDFMIDENPNTNENVTVVSNFAENRAGNQWALTITNCKRYGLYKLADGSQSNLFGTDCDTGRGSSGAQAYLKRNNEPKMFGIVSAEVKEVKEGGPWNATKLSTSITKFDSTLFETVTALRHRKQSSSTSL